MNLFTGARGFIGSHMVEELGRPGDATIDLKSGDDIRTFEFHQHYNVIYHLAAQASIPKSFENPVLCHAHNVLGTLRILEHAKRVGAKVVFSSSASVYDLVSPYAMSKYVCEEYMRYYWKLGVKSVALRYFNVFGERQELANEGYSLALSKFLYQKKREEPFTIYGTGEQRRDFVYVKDVVEANRLVAEWLDKASEFQTVDIGTGTNYSVNEVVDMIGKNHPRVYLPPRIEPFENKADTTKAWQFLGWKPKTTLEQWLDGLK